jgi:hypothetical protein
MRRFRIVQFWILAAGLVVTAPGGAGRERTPSAAKGALRWEAHSVAKIPNGYQVAVADVNGDGLRDIIAIGASTGNAVWYETLP